MNQSQMPSSRYVLPSFIEQSAQGTKETNPYSKLFEERIIFLGTQVDDTSANDIMAQLLVLESQDPDRDITMYINSPGGSFTALMATMTPCATFVPMCRPCAWVRLLPPPLCSWLRVRRVSVPRYLTPVCSFTSRQLRVLRARFLIWRFRPPRLSACAS